MKSNVYYVIERFIALHFQLLELVCFTDRWLTFYKTRMNCLNEQYLLTIAINKKEKRKGKHAVMDKTRLTGWIKPGETWQLNLNFVTTPKLIPLHSFFAKKVFIICVWLIPASLGCTTSKLFWYQYSAAYPFQFKVFNQIGDRPYFQLVETKKYFACENAKEVVEGLVTGSFVTVTNLTKHSCWEILPGKFFIITCRVLRHV